MAYSKVLITDTSNAVIKFCLPLYSNSRSFDNYTFSKMKSTPVSINSRLKHLHPAAPTVDYEELLADWLATKRSEHTQRVYKADIANFLSDIDSTLGKLLESDRFAAYELVSRYKGLLLAQHLSSATINRRLAAIKSLVNYAYDCGRCEYVLDNVKLLKLEGYRDTSGVSVERFKQILATVDESSLKGKRDRAILMLLWANALRRSEVAQTNIGDFNAEERTLRIKGKGRGSYETVSLSDGAIASVKSWLDARGETNPNAPLFCSVNPGYKDGRLTPQAIYNIVSDRSIAAGIAKKMSPHRIRHSSITAALDATDGDVRAVQKLSRHSSLNTLMVYDDNRVNAQAKVTNLLDNLL
jgi:integrase/recombinase XerC